jgi:hypothetical protein
MASLSHRGHDILCRILMTADMSSILDMLDCEICQRAGITNMKPILGGQAPITDPGRGGGFLDGFLTQCGGKVTKLDLRVLLDGGKNRKESILPGRELGWIVGCDCTHGDVP